PAEPSVTSACEAPRLWTLRYPSALLPKSFERPGPKSVSPAMYCPGVKVVVWCIWIVDMCCPLRFPRLRDSECSCSGRYWISPLLSYLLSGGHAKFSVRLCAMRAKVSRTGLFSSAIINAEEWACDALEDSAKERTVSSDFWLALRDDASKMRL